MVTAMRKLSIIQLVSARYDWGGIEQHTKDLARGLQDRGHKLLVVARDVEFFVNMYREVCPVFTFPIRGSVDLSSIYGLAKLIRREKVDIIHTHTSRDAWMALFAASLAGRGKVVTTRHVPLAAKRDGIHQWYYRRLAGIYCVSDYVRNIFLGNPPAVDPDKVITVYPGINIDKLKAGPTEDLRKRLGIAGGEFVIGFVGRITREKGIDVLLRAVAEFRKARDNFRVLVVGEVNPITPGYLAELKTLGEQLAIAGRVEFFGFAKNIADVLYAMDVLVLPSVTPETFGLVLGEALACGKPVISTDTGAQREFIVSGETGYLVAAGAVNELAAALAKLNADPTLSRRMGETGRQMIEDRFSQQAAIRVIEQSYHDLLADDK